MIVLRASLVLGRSSHPTQVIQSPAVAWLEVLQGTTEKRHRQKEDRGGGEFIASYKTTSESDAFCSYVPYIHIRTIGGILLEGVI